MAQFATELFAHFVYSSTLSYHDLLDSEEELKILFSRLVEDQGGEFMHFEAMGDGLRAQCVFAAYDEEIFHALCDAIAPAMNDEVEARLLFVSKDLEELHLYIVSGHKWQEAILFVPPGPIGRALLEEKTPTPGKLRPKKKA